MKSVKDKSRKTPIECLAELSDFEEETDTKLSKLPLKKRILKQNGKENKDGLSPKKTSSPAPAAIPLRQTGRQNRRSKQREDSSDAEEAPSRQNTTKEKLQQSQGDESEDDSDMDELFRSFKKKGLRMENNCARKSKSVEKTLSGSKRTAEKKLVTPLKIVLVEGTKHEARKCLFAEDDTSNDGTNNISSRKSIVNGKKSSRSPSTRCRKTATPDNSSQEKEDASVNGDVKLRRGKRPRSEDVDASSDSASYDTPLKRMRSDKTKERSMTPITPTSKSVIDQKLNEIESPVNSKESVTKRRKSNVQQFKELAKEVLKMDILKISKNGFNGRKNSRVSSTEKIINESKTASIEKVKLSEPVKKNRNSSRIVPEDVGAVVTPRKAEDIAGTPRTRGAKRAHSEEPIPEDNSSYTTPLKRRRSDIPRQRELQVTPSTRVLKKCETPRTPLEEARVSLHVAAVPDSLPCREQEFNNIYSFVENKVVDGIGGCMYISGVPGTGKTATVTSVIRSLKKAADVGELPPFSYVEINGMRLSDPRQAYTQLWQHISKTKERLSTDNAQKKLDVWFNKADSKKVTTVVLVDELDIMCTRKQDVVYNFLDWPSKPRSRLVVLTIANTMDMPERKLKGRVNSRLGLTRLTFLPYTHKQLEEIVLARLHDSSEAFVPDAVRLATRKVAAVSGDARRALDICRRATEFPAPDECVKMSHIEQAIREMTNSNIVKVIRSCSEIEQIFLRSVSEVCIRTGLEEVDLLKVLDHTLSLCTLEGLRRPPVTSVLSVCNRLRCSRLLYTNNHRSGILQRLTLNFTQDDLHYALKVDI